MSQQTLLVEGPDPVETADIHFKLCCKLKISDSTTKQIGGHCNLVAVSQYYGLIFVGNSNGFTVLKTNSVNGKTSFNEYPRRDIILNSIPTHVSVDFSQSLLAVASASTSGVTLNLYSVASFSYRDVLPVRSIPLAKNQAVVDLTWQPNPDSNLMICMSDGLVLALNVLNPDAPVNTLPSTTNATCFCWSPKGKQIVIGCGNGTLSQYKPDLKLVKTLPAPSLYDGNEAVVGVLWISSFQFAVAYNDKTVDTSFPVIMIVNAPKNEPISFINYDDITYSVALFRDHQVYMNHQSAWNLIFVSSANSIEVALLHSKDSSTWEQWLLGDASRAELPLNADHQETFPLGLAFDLTSEEVVTLGEKTLPPMPRILLLSDEGVLSVFTVVNAIDNAAQLCSPPKENVDDSLFNVPAPVQQPSGKVEKSPQSVIVQAPPSAAATAAATAAVVPSPPAAAAVVPSPTAAAVVPSPPTAAAVVPSPPTAAAVVPSPPTAATVVPSPPVAAAVVPSPAAAVTSPPVAAAVVPSPPPAAVVPSPPAAADVVSSPPAATVVSFPAATGGSFPAATVVPFPSAAAVPFPPGAAAPLGPAHSFGTPKPTYTVTSVEFSFIGSQGAASFPNKPAGDVKTQFFQAPQQQQQVDTQPIVISTQGGFSTSSTFKYLPNQFGVSNTSSSVTVFPSFPFGFANTSTNLFHSNIVSSSTLPGKPSVTITPISQMSVPKTGAVSPVFTGAGSVAVSKSPSQVNLFRSMTPTKPVEPVGQPAITPTKKGDEVPGPATKQEETKAKASGETAEPSPQELATVDGSVYWNALQEEIEHFNSELRQLSERMRSLDIQIGTEEDKAKLRKRLESLHEFSKELKETTASQSSEIHSVVTDLMESFAWLEDAKSRNLQRKNPSFVELKKSEELDPISARHMSDIAHLKYYIESQLKQLTSHLEKEWMDHQDSYRMDVKNRMTVPPLEEVYKTMHFQLKILSKQKALVEELKEKMAAKKRKNKTQMALLTNSNQVLSNSNTENSRISELSKLADNLLQLKINKGEHLSDMKGWEAMRAQLKAIAERSKKLSSDKQAALRDVLSERDMVKIRPVKTTFESSSFLRSVPVQKSVAKKESPKVADVKKGEEESKQEKSVSSSGKESLNLIAQPKEVVERNTEGEGQQEETKSIFVFGKPSSSSVTPLQFGSQEKEEESPLASLSGIVSNIGKENEVPSKPAQSFMFGESIQTQNKAMNFFSVSPGQQQTKQGGSAQTFVFSIPKPDLSFGSKVEGLFAAKSSFGVPANPPASGGFGTLSSPKLEVTKSSPTPVSAVVVAATTTTTTPSTPVTTNAVTTTTTSSALSFSFSATNTTTATSLPQMALSFDEQKSESGTGNVFSGAGNVVQSTAAPIFGNVTPVFKTPTNKTGFESQTSATFGVPKSSETVSKGLIFGFASSTTENKIPVTQEVSVVTSSKQESQEVDVVTVEESAGKTEEGKGSPKATPTSTFVFGGAVAVPKSVVEVTPTTTVAQTVVTTTMVQVASTVQSSPTVTTTSDSAKPVVVAAVETPKTSAPGVQAGVTTTSSVFSSPTTTTPLLFGQAAAAATATVTATATPTVTGTTATTTVATVFPQTPSSTTTVFGQVSSTTPTISVFKSGSILPTTTTTSIFGGSPVSKPIFGQASAATTPTTSSIFGGTAATTPTTNTFGQVSTSPATTPSVFGTKPDVVAQTTNIFGQLLSDSNRQGTVFGSPTTTSAPTTTSSNIFKNIFGGAVSGSASTTTSSIFGTTSTTSSSIFPQTTSVFGQPTTTTASIFGQTPTSNSFFGQNICSPFGGGSSGATGTTSESAGGFGSKPVFGQSLFGQGTSSTSFFGGSQNTSSIFGSSTSSSGNVFQTPTTSTFGSTSPGPFSSGQGSVAETGFRAANTFQKPLGGFGSPPVFGGSPTAAPAFGASPTFSGSASFGSLPAFGSRPVFDSSQSGTFGQSQGHSTTFENLANQNTVGFGNLAQQSQSQGFRVGGFGSAPAFENKAAFGGNSFSSWRSS